MKWVVVIVAPRSTKQVQNKRAFVCHPSMWIHDLCAHILANETRNVISTDRASESRVVVPSIEQAAKLRMTRSQTNRAIERAPVRTEIRYFILDNPAATVGRATSCNLRTRPLRTCLRKTCSEPVKSSTRPRVAKLVTFASSNL